MAQPLVLTVFPGKDSDRFPAEPGFKKWAIYLL